MHELEGTKLDISSVESERFSDLRECEVVRTLRFATGKERALYG